jgi:putative lipoprotein
MWDKSVYQWLGATVLAASLAGCTSDGKPDGESDGENSGPEQAESAESVENIESVSAKAESATALEQALLERYPSYLGEVRYFQAEQDLNDDGNPEVIVHIVGPQVCGSGGCETLVFSHKTEELTLVAEMTLTRPPVMVAEASTHGWHDLGVAVSGGGASGSYARLRYDGEQYPSNPTVSPVETSENEIEGNVATPTYEDFTEGQLLREDADA